MSERGHRAKTSTARGVASIVFGFFLSVALALVVVLAAACIGTFSKQGFLSLFDDTYYESLLTYTNEKIMAYTYPTGIDPSVVENVITKEDVERDVTGMVRAAFEDVEYKPDLSGIESRLTAGVSTFLLSSDAEVSGASEEIVSTYVSEIVAIYLDAMKLPGLDSMMKVHSAYYEYLNMALGICAGLAVVLIVSIRSLHHFLHRSLRFVAYATGGAALMCLIGPLMLYLSHTYDGLRLRPLYFYHFGITAITRLLWYIIAGGIVLAAVTVLLVVLISRMREAIVHRRSRSKGHE